MPNRNSAFSGLNEFYQFFHIVKAVIITNDPLAMIYDTSFFVFLKAVKKPLHSVSLYKQGKPIRLDFAQ